MIKKLLYTLFITISTGALLFTLAGCTSSTPSKNKDTKPKWKAISNYKKATTQDQSQGEYEMRKMSKKERRSMMLDPTKSTQE